MVALDLGFIRLGVYIVNIIRQKHCSGSDKQNDKEKTMQLKTASQKKWQTNVSW